MKDLLGSTTIEEFLINFPTEKTVSDKLIQLGVLKNAQKCEKCNKAMILRTIKGRYDWKCRTLDDCSVKSIRSGSIFSNTRLNLRDAICLLHLLSIKHPIHKILSKIHVSRKTVSKFRKILDDAHRDYPHYFLPTASMIREKAEKESEKEASA